MARILDKSGNDVDVYSNQSTQQSGLVVVNPDGNQVGIPTQYQYANITTTTTTTIKSAPGFLHTITINKPVASSTITILDSTSGSGTKIGTITLPATLLSEGPMTAIYDVSYLTGLTIVTGTGASDITVSYL